MNSKQTLLTTLLAFAIISSIGITNVFATGGLDDEEEEEAIKELQGDVSSIEDSVESIQEDVDGLTLNLEEGLNDVTAICPTAPAQEEEVPEEQNNETQSGCNPVPEEEPPQAIIPEINVTEPEEEQGCNPIPEPAPVENETSDLVPIICPINGELLGYTNTTSGEQLPISAGNQSEVVEEETPTSNYNGGGFLSGVEIPNEEEQAEQETGCNATDPAEPVNQGVSQPIEDINYDLDCQCFVSQNSDDTVPQLEGGN